MWEKEELKGSVLFSFFFDPKRVQMPPNADEDCILDKQKNDACERSRLFRARMASYEIVFRVNPRETREKHIEEWFSIGFERFLERHNFVECGLRFLFFLNRFNHRRHTQQLYPFFPRTKLRVAFQSVSRYKAKRKRKEKRTLPVACIDWDMI